MHKFNFSGLQNVNRNAKLYIINAAIGFISMSAFGVLQGLYLRELGFTESFIGTLIFAKTLSTGLGALPGGVISDRIGRKKSLVLAILFISVGGVLQVVSKTGWIIILTAVIFGFGHAIKATTEGPFLLENSTPDQRIALFSVNFALKNTATVIGNMASGWISDSLELSMGSISAMSTTMILFSLVSALAIIPVLMIKDKSNKSKGNIRETVSAFYHLVIREKVQKLLTYNLLIGFGAGLVVPFFNVYLKEVLNISKTEVGIIMSAAQVATVIGTLLIPLIATRLGKVATVVICELISIPFLLAISFSNGFYMVAISFFMRSALMNMAHPAIQNLSMELVEENVRAKMSSLIALSNSTARSFGAFAGGYIMELMSYSFPYYITAIAYVAATAFFVNVFKGYSLKEYFFYIIRGIRLFRIRLLSLTSKVRVEGK